MNKVSNEEKERLRRLNDAYLYDVGYHHVNDICDETDRLLEEYEDLEVPDSMNHWFIEYKNKFEKKERHRNILKKALDYTKRTAILFSVVVVAGAIVTLMVKDFRVQFFEFAYEIMQKENNQNEDIYSELEVMSDYYYPRFLPEDFTLIKIKVQNDIKNLLFRNPEGEEILFSQTKMNTKLKYDIDTENITQVEINQNIGYLLVQDNMSIINWSEKDTSFTIQGNIEKSVLIDIAKSIKQGK
ncbi:DUF4367 domain-containing protein [Petrocella sp. FN5]|uniref:DUF4367 domain-containing protein n=1 Tax=Petrocella sp. FN5 TaxID=3032002 RepID=UPI0023DCAFCB|nr:DUF4367 domain-containing protein [Petrocella sp. FN5]MDF1617916.1 DUF4367 domain-containing protein [Petrocella sp. FN5]